MLRSLAAASLALWLGFQLHLEAPFSAASTVLLLIHPLQGAVVGKGFNRVLGTVVGLAVALLLTGMFAQKMLLFILGIGVWLGLCVGAMTLLRHYHATAAVVAGYTVCLALGPAIVTPQLGFDHIVARCTAVALGVLSLSLVATLFSRKTVEPKLNRALRDVCSRTVRLLATRFEGEHSADPAIAQRPLAIDISKVDELLGIGRGESFLIRSRLAALRAGLAYLHAVVLDEGATERPVSPSFARTGMDLQRLADALPGFCVAADEVREMQHRLAQLPENNTSQQRLKEQLADLFSALSSFASLEHRGQMPARAVGFHRHYGDALRNGVRALLATLAIAAFWYLSAWDQGPTLLAVSGPCCTLLATSPAPAQGLARFFEGTVYAIVAAAACKFLVLPHISGLALLTVVMIAFWAVGIQATTRPRHALQGIAYLIGFNTLVSTGLAAQYDFADFANQALAWIVALAICLLAFLLLPGKPHRHPHVLKKAILQDTRRLLRHGHRMDLLKWQARQQHRLVTLQALSGAHDQQSAQAGSTALQLSRQWIRLQRQTRDLDPESSVGKCARRGDRRISRYASHPAISAVQARRTSRSLTRLDAHDLAAGYLALAGLLETYASANQRTFDRRLRGQPAQ
ncbi:FUSC family protein [Pseudomonas corrugata]|uniref:FUSC family protein n=1 Tax=Pseudomonas corrugata TaxID=47879 RepID=UPI001585FEC1|nr:FUSC family protein [Pseudomonas corrugata]MCI0996681.1 FUSC family protein [Pseudomonas corrugata]NUT68983.1 FUSC family protein [Pseudomonas corrugata]